MSEKQIITDMFKSVKPIPLYSLKNKDIRGDRQNGISTMSSILTILNSDTDDDAFTDDDAEAQLEAEKGFKYLKIYVKSVKYMGLICNEKIKSIFIPHKYKKGKYPAILDTFNFMNKYKDNIKRILEDNYEDEMVFEEKLADFYYGVLEDNWQATHPTSTYEENKQLIMD